MENTYILTNGSKFIRQNLDGKYEQVGNIVLADTYESKKIAMNIMLNSIPKVLSRSYYVAEIVGDEIVQSCATRPPKAVKKKGVKGFSYKEEASDTWYSKFIGIDELFAQAMKRNNELSQELSDVESKITDLEHYLEFCSLNACSGYKVYKKLKELFIQRRKLKNEQKIVMTINKNCSASEAIKNIVNTINNGTGHEYKPRVFVELFESGIDSIK